MLIGLILFILYFAGLNLNIIKFIFASIKFMPFDIKKVSLYKKIVLNELVDLIWLTQLFLGKFMKHD